MLYGCFNERRSKALQNIKRRQPDKAFMGGKGTCGDVTYFVSPRMEIRGEFVQLCMSHLNKQERKES